MAGYTGNFNMTAQNHGKKKALIAAVSVIAALAVLLTVFLLTKNSIFYSVAKSKAEKQDFSAAMSFIENSGDDKADVLRDYINLRIEINQNYPLLLSDFDIEKIKSWSKTAERVCAYSGALGESISADAVALSDILSQIISCEAEYNALKADILNLMDVFNEINRLHTKDAEGKNTSFTIAEERNKISTWTQLNNRILSFVAEIPGSENIYLINYLAKEAQGEISELTSAIDSVAANGYGDTALVRFSGDAVKLFPDIKNSSGESVNLLDKENYEKFMFEEICNELTQCLAPYYAP